MIRQLQAQQKVVVGNEFSDWCCIFLNFPPSGFVQIQLGAEDSASGRRNYTLFVLNKEREKLQHAIKAAEKEHDREIENSVALENCVGILGNEGLINFVISGDEILRRKANDYSYATSNEICERNLDQVVDLAQRLLSTGMEAVETEDTEPEPNARAL